MKKVEKVIVLKNRYTGEVVHTKEYNNVEKLNGINFIKVFNPNLPARVYLVNRDAFDIMTK